MDIQITKAAPPEKIITDRSGSKYDKAIFASHSIHQ